MTTISCRNTPSRTRTEFVGLAPFLRMSIAGTDILPVGRQMLARAQELPNEPNCWMNLSTAMFCLGQRELGLAIQEQAIEMQRVYHLQAVQQPARFRLLMMMMPGDLSANAPLDCLLEGSDVDLDFYFVSPGSPLASPIPAHDAVIVGISADDDARAALASLEPVLADWPKPVINAPHDTLSTERNTASLLLQNAPGLLIPPTLRASRDTLQRLATGESSLPALLEGCNFPIILRPEGSHGGRGLEKIDCSEDISGYLSRVEGVEFFLAPFVDYSSSDGLFRKFRVALIDGVPFASHMAVSSHWMVHYVNADMYEDARKRAEEGAFMANFEDFARHHRGALEAIAQRTKLDYVCIDCAETADGQLLVFEIDHAMVVHAMDPEDIFPYKQVHMKKLRDAFRDFLLRRTGQ